MKLDILNGIVIVFLIIFLLPYLFEKKYMYATKELNKTHFNTGDIVLFNTKGYCNKFKRNIIKVAMFYTNIITGDDFQHIGIIKMINEIPYVIHMHGTSMCITDNSCTFSIIPLFQYLDKNYYIFHMPIKKSFPIDKIYSQGKYISVFDLILTHYFKIDNYDNHTFSCVSFVNKILYDNNVINQSEYSENKNQLIKEFILHNKRRYGKIQYLYSKNNIYI
jgi:hypothetical protein